MTMSIRRGIIVMFVVIGCLAYGCGYKVSHVMYSNETYSPKADSYNLSVFNTPPDRKYIKIAHIYAMPSNGGDISADSADKAINALKKRAKELGADALIVTKIHMAPSGTVGQGGFSGEGDAIRWRE